MPNSYTGEVSASKCGKCGAVANFDFECECETVQQELKRVSKLPFDRPPMVWYKRFINWLKK